MKALIHHSLTKNVLGKPEPVSEQEEKKGRVGWRKIRGIPLFLLFESRPSGCIALLVCRRFYIAHFNQYTVDCTDLLCLSALWEINRGGTLRKEGLTSADNWWKCTPTGDSWKNVVLRFCGAASIAEAGLIEEKSRVNTERAGQHLSSLINPVGVLNSGKRLHCGESSIIVKTPIMNLKCFVLCSWSSCLMAAVVVVM